jgi:hypothetical protein
MEHRACGLSMKCAIMQPTYLPWAGYFNLIAEADVFIFLDDVQYERSSWQNRNRVLVNGQPHWLTIPAERTTLSQIIRDVQIDDTSVWRKKHMRLLEQTYGKHPHGADMLEAVQPIGDTRLAHLAELTITLILQLCERLKLKKRFARTSELSIDAPRSQRLIQICQHVQCDEYLSPVGAARYLEKDGAFKDAPVRLRFQDFTPAVYPQARQNDFVSHLSIVDVVANLGWTAAREYVIGSYGRVQCD